MQITIKMNAGGYAVQLRHGLFRKTTLKPQQFSAMVGSFGEFFEARSRTNDLRSTVKKIRRKSYHLSEELRGNHVIGVIKRKQLKMTWAFLVFLDEQIKEMGSLAEPTRKFRENPY